MPPQKMSAPVREDGDMTSSVHLEMVVPGTFDQVWAMLTNSDYITSKGAELVSVSQTNGTMDLVLRRDLTGQIPAAVASYVSNPPILIETQIWQQAGESHTRVAQVQLHLDGAPATIEGTATLSPTSGTAQEFTISIDLTVKVSVPLFGVMAEGLVCDMLRAQIAEEEILARTWQTTHQ
ncbi:MAG: DUF2505 family protein [Actinobacteria bacterium]|nr:DUF2505 family protein [Actinomycetota bacterium]